jgi:hypothetical protein
LLAAAGVALPWIDVKHFVWIAMLATYGCGAAGGGDDDDAPAGDGSPVAADAAPPPERVAQLVRGDDKPRLVLEIDAVAGFEPRAGATADLTDLLEQILDKPAGVDAVADGAIASRGADHAWTDAELFDLGDDSFDLAVGADTIKLHVMFVDGHSARDGDSSVILGLAWSHTHLVLFKATIERVCGGAIVPPLLRDQLCESAELAIWTHEVGHLIGLVDNGLAMVEPHRDPDHGAHDDSDACVMYWAYEGDALIDTLADRLIAGNDAPLPFDDACLADIARVRDAP